MNLAGILGCGFAGRAVLSWTVVPVCRVCGGGPAADVNFRGVRGALWAMDEVGEYGPFCRDCGLANYRATSTVTLKKAWWGAISFFVGPYFLITNLAAARKLPRVPATGSHGEPLHPGKPLWRRPAILGLTMPVAIISLLVLLTVTTTHDDPLATACVSVSPLSQSMYVTPCSEKHHFKVKVVVESGAECPPDAPYPATLDSRSDRSIDNRTYCLVRDGDWPLLVDPYEGS